MTPRKLPPFDDPSVRQRSQGAKEAAAPPGPTNAVPSDLRKELYGDKWRPGTIGLETFASRALRAHDAAIEKMNSLRSGRAELTGPEMPVYSYGYRAGFKAGLAFSKEDFPTQESRRAKLGEILGDWLAEDTLGSIE